MRLYAAAAILSVALSVTAAKAGPSEWSEQATAAAMGYCLARHPYIPAANPPYTAEGFEVPNSPGVVGAVRRNYQYSRASVDYNAGDPGQGQTCAQACYQWGKGYLPSYGGVPLRYMRAGSTPIADGIGDMAATVHRDADYYLRQPQIAAMTGRPMNYHESDVAQADYCCCHLTSPAPVEPKIFKKPDILPRQLDPAKPRPAPVDPKQ